jgi:hypothetical protein
MPATAAFPLTIHHSPLQMVHLPFAIHLSPFTFHLPTPQAFLCSPHSDAQGGHTATAVAVTGAALIK